MAKYAFDGRFEDQNIKHLFKLTSDWMGTDNTPHHRFEITGSLDARVKVRQVPNGVGIELSRGLINLIGGFFSYVTANIIHFGGTELSPHRAINRPSFETLARLRNDLAANALEIEGVPAYSRDRALLNAGMQVIAFHYLFFHELAHFNLGHLELKTQREISLKENEALEFEADMIGGGMMGHCLGGAQGDLPFHEFDWVSLALESGFGKGASNAYLCCYVVSALLQLFSYNRWNSQTLSSSHPPAEIRRVIAANMIAKRSFSDPVSYKTIIKVADDDARRDINSLLVTPTLEAFNETDIVPIQVYTDELRKKASLLRAEIERNSTRPTM